MGKSGMTMMANHIPVTAAAIIVTVKVTFDYTGESIGSQPAFLFAGIVSPHFHEHACSCG
jgi:hypothetical protein